MKLIATLATLAALVCQTEAVDSASGVVEVVSVNVGDAPCTDKVVLKAVGSVALAATNTIKFSSSKLSTKKTATGDLHVVADATCHVNGGSAGDDASAVLSTVAATEAAGVTTWTWTVATAKACDTGDVSVTLQNVCNNGLTDYSGKAHDLKYTALTNDVKASVQAAAVGSTAAVGTAVTNNPTKLAAFTVEEMPVAKSTTGPFKATWTGHTGINGKSLVLNLPKDYIIPTGSTCNITSAKTSPTIVTLRASSVSASSSNSIVFGTVITAGTLDDTSKTTFNCDKVTSGATIADNVDDAVSVKAHTTSNQNTHVAYAVANTPKPTAKPTAKAADSPASVATASGVVVGALGVAALFLA